MRGPLPLNLALDGAFRGDCLILACLQGEPPPIGCLPEPLAQAALLLASRPGWTGREGQTIETSLATGDTFAAITLRGLGKASALDRFKCRAWFANCLEEARTNGAGTVALALPPHPEFSGPQAAERTMVQYQTAAYRFDRFLTPKEEPEAVLESLSLVPPEGEAESYRQALGGALALSAAISRGRDLCNTPPNEATPSWFEAEALALAEEFGLAASIYGVEQLRALGMGGILAVGAGSAQPPRLIKLEVGDQGPIVALVGKGITFDTGGISIKSAAGMDEMKYDKGGACTALAAATAVAALRLPVRLRVYLPVAENMPDGASYRPGDILRCYNGKTVEIINTDAEGRLILADALALAVEEGAEALLEMSTLTGACVIALGRQAAGLYTPDEELAQSLLEAARASGERLWRMPLWPEMVELIKGSHGDLKNSSERWGSANLAATFLAQFVEPLKTWAHLDIAGPINSVKESGGGVGATGYGVALVLTWIRALLKA